VAVPLVAIFTLQATTLEVRALSAAETAAFLLVGLPARVLVDRLRRRPVMVAADWGRALLMGSIPVAYALGGLTMWQLFAVSLLGGVVTVFDTVTSRSYLPSLVGRQQVVEGNAKLTATQQVAEVSGRPLCGWLVQLLGAPYAVLADAVSFVVFALSVSRIGAFVTAHHGSGWVPERHLSAPVGLGPGEYGIRHDRAPDESRRGA
jgi:MFS family permease